MAFAQQQGLFDLPPAVEQCAFDVQGREEGQGAAATASSPVAVVGARRLDCEIAIDGPMCEQLVMEAVAYGADGEARKGWYRPSTGSIYYLELQQANPSRRHHVTVSRDSHQHLSILQHTHYDPTVPASGSGKELPSISFLSYNMWHNQPAAWVYPDASTRWAKYWERLAYLASVIWTSGADVVGIQEVRYDQTFAPAGYHLGLSHLLDLLAALAVGEAKKAGGGGASKGRAAPFQYVYQPAMSFAGHQGHLLREEEGVAILSRFPVRRTDYLLLPRDYADAQDGHQRVVLHAQVEPELGGALVDVYVTHFALSSAARDAAAASIVAWAAEQGHENVVLMGDLNAEPDEESLRILREGGFRDAWEDMHPFVPAQAEVCEVAKQEEEEEEEEEGEEEEEAELSRADVEGAAEKDACERRSRASETQAQERHAQASFTFPTCDPVKRIDYVLFRGKSLRPVAARLCGAEPTEESKNWESPGGGMLERNGPVFASDHLAVLVNFEDLRI